MGKNEKYYLLAVNFENEARNLVLQSVVNCAGKNIVDGKKIECVHLGKGKAALIELDNSEKYV